MDQTHDDQTSFDQLKLWRSDRLKAFLRERGMRVSCKRDELIALVYSCILQKIPKKETSQEVKKVKAADYQKKLLMEDGTRIEDPWLLEGWTGQGEGMKSWPPMDIVDMGTYLLSQEDKELGKRLLLDYKVTHMNIFYEAMTM